MSRYESRGPPSKRGRMDGAPRDRRGPTLREHEIEEELNKFDPNARPNKVLLFTVLNADYPIDVSIIYKVTSNVGKVDRIVIFRRGYVIHAMVEFESMESANAAKRNLHGCDIYSGCCTLKVEYAKTDRLQVKKNDEMSWDYTDEFTRGGSSAMKVDRPVLLSEPPKMNGMAAGGGSGSMGMGSMGGGSSMSLAAMGGMGGGMGGMGAGMGGMANMAGMMGGMDRGMSRAMSNFNGMTNTLMGAMNGMNMNSMNAMDLNSRMGDGYVGQGGRSANVYGGASASGGMSQGRGAVAMIYGIEPDKFNCQRIFNLFCQYGNIRKVMFLKTKEGCVMMEMADPDGVQHCIDNVSNSAMFGLKVRLDWSKKDYVTEVKNPHTLPDGTLSFMNFEQDRNNRFDNPERAAKNRILPAAKFLHFFNVPKMEDADLENIFTDSGAPSPTRIKWFPSASERSASGLIEFDSTQEACEALVICNHSKIEGDKFPYIMKLCFSNGPRERRERRD